MNEEVKATIKNKREIKKRVQAALEEIETRRDINPPRENGTNNQLFTFPTTIRNKDGTIYTNFTGIFLIRSSDGMTSILIIYDWTTNAILAHPVKDLKDDTVIAAFSYKFNFF